MIICTVAAANYIPHAECLAKSLRQTQKTHQSVLCLIERDASALATDGYETAFSQTILASEIGIKDFDAFIFRHSLVEACTAIKAQLLLWAMHNFPNETYFVYLDPDIRAYSRFCELESLLTLAQIIVTPHLLRDQETYDGVRDNLFRALVAGTFNLGFLALSRSPAANDFLNWWNEKLQISCYMEPRRGIFVDQRWVLFAAQYFDITVLREPGYNVANWNVSERVATSIPDNVTQYNVNGRPLRFFHFSGIDSGRDLYYMTKYLPSDSPYFDLRREYLQELESFNSRRFSTMSWSFDHFLSGEHVNGEVRQAYRTNGPLRSKFPYPFSVSNEALFLEL